MSTEPLLGVGSELGSYRLLARLGQGGMGVVYRAEDLRLGRSVALKLLTPQLSGDSHFRERFLRESRLAASIEHAGIVPVYEAGEADGVLYIAMRYVEGADLGERLRREGPLDPRRAVELTAELAGALDAAHARGLVHRDVKPSNVLIADDAAGEHAYLADFGVTLDAAAREKLTGSGQLLGTVGYLAPELIRGDDVDGRADIYALGCVLFECLTGDVPFSRPTEVATIYAHLEGQPPRASRRRPGLPAAMDDVLALALAKDPSRRWQTATELATAARAALSGARPNRRGRGAGRTMPRSALAAVGLIVLAAAVAAVAMLRSDGAAAPPKFHENAVAVIDPATGFLTAEVAVGAASSRIAAGDGAAWVTDRNAGTVSRLDPATHTIRQTVRVGGGPSALAVGEGSVWVVNALEGTLSRISRATNEVVDEIQVGTSPVGVCVAGGSVWVANAAERTVWRIDPASGRRKDVTRLESEPTGLACGDGAVWASSSAGRSVTRIAPDGGAVRAIRVAGGAGAIASGEGAIWVASTLGGSVSRIDPKRRVVVATVRLGSAEPPADLAIGEGDVWVSSTDAGTVTRIDTSRDEVEQTLQIGNHPQGLAVVDGALWVGLGASSARHRGGTLRILSEQPLDKAGLDPASSYAFFSWALLDIAYDGLTAYRRTGGRDGATLVPDLAVSLSAPTNRGRTYAFRLRPGIRYATGALVVPSDIRRGLERALRNTESPAAMFYSRIVGAETCATLPERCDLSRGIVTDDADGTIVFHLTAPDPELPHKLALPTAAAIPPGVGRPGRGGQLPPATGPYGIDEVDRDGVVTLARNQRFRSWSSAAVPDGYADEITVRGGVDPRLAVPDVQKGKADYLGGPPTRGQARRLLTSDPGQFHMSVKQATEYFFLNTRVPPFDDVLVRRAVNFAVDRRAAVELVGGEDLAQPSCQILPPNFPGYRPNCPYTIDAGPGRPWRAPDLARARRLVGRSRTAGMRVKVSVPGRQFAPVARLLVRTLRDLGYRAGLRILAPEKYIPYVSDPRRRAQVGVQKWAPDYPAASNFLRVLFGCPQPGVEPAASWNWSRFCDRTTERLATRATGLQASDPVAADALWARVDRRVVGAAAAVPLLNPKEIDFVSKRVGNYQHSPQWGVLLDQLSVR